MWVNQQLIKKTKIEKEPLKNEEIKIIIRFTIFFKYLMH